MKDSDRAILYYLLQKSMKPKEIIHVHHASGGGVSQHGRLTGLADDDHPHYLLINGSRAMTGNLDLDHNVITESDYDHWIHFSMIGGAVDVTINTVPAGVLVQDRHYHRIVFSVDVAPGGGKTASMSITNGTDTMTVNLGAAETSGYSTANEFDFDVSAETLTLHYSQTAGGAATKGFAMIKYHYKENA